VLAWAPVVPSASCDGVCPVVGAVAELCEEAARLPTPSLTPPAEPLGFSSSFGAAAMTEEAVWCVDGSAASGELKQLSARTMTKSGSGGQMRRAS